MKRRDKIEEVLASFQAGVAKFRTVQVAHASTGIDDGEYTCEEAEGEEDALIARNVAPPLLSVSNFIGRSVAKYFSLANGRKEL